MSASEDIIEQVKFISGDNFYGATTPGTLTMKDLKRIKKDLGRGKTKLYKVYYIPSWSKKYPMWINRILFYLINNKILPYKIEKYL